ncbi:MAG: nicotinate-nucleotide adenylyltransferase [Eubacteriales bacterium]
MLKNTNETKCIGLYGGSFDPIHFGHIALARKAKAELSLCEIIFIPTKKQPFKLDKTPASCEDRVNMLKLVIQNEPDFSISMLEIDREGISYTIDTLYSFRTLYKDDTLYYLILGADSFLQIEKWHKSDEILSTCNLAVGIRPGTSIEKLEITKKRIHEKYKTDIVFLNNKELEISSTKIKENIKNSKSLDGLLSKEVANYIDEKHLYK